MIDLLWTGFGAVAGAGLGGLAGWVVSDRWRTRRGHRRPGIRRVLAGTGVVIGAFVAAAVSAPPPGENELMAIGPAMTAIRTHYPGAFAEMRWAAKGVDPRDPVALQDRLRPLVAELIRVHRAEIDDASAQAMAGLMLDETEALRDAKPEACVAALRGRPLRVDLRSVEGADLRRRDAEVTAALIEQVATRPQPPPTRLTDEESQRLTEYALAKLTSGDREIVVPILQAGRQPSNPREAGAYCAFQRARLGAAMDAQPGVLRRLMGS